MDAAYRHQGWQCQGPCGLVPAGYMKVASNYVFHLIKSVYFRLCFTSIFIRGVLVVANELAHFRPAREYLMEFTRVRIMLD